MSMRINRSSLITLFIVILFCFQSSFASTIGLFDYIDELYSLLWISLIILGYCKRPIKEMKFRIPLIIFVCAGLIGNFIYRYQPINVVFIDLLTNLKFFFSIFTTVIIFSKLNVDRIGRTINKFSKFYSTVLFILCLLDEVFHLFPVVEYRYGLPSIQLFYPHVTYLAGVAVFLIATLCFFYQKGNEKYLLMALFVLCATLRSKAIGGALAFVAIYFVTVIYRKKLKVWHIALLVLLGFYIAWEQINFYYIQLSGSSARSLLTITSFEVLKDYFPIGTGFGTYASHVAGQYYSPVYVKYGFSFIHELSNNNSRAFFDDTFWPIIIGQTGFIGTCCYVLIQTRIFKTIQKVKLIDTHKYAATLFVFAYLMISSTSEPAFNNAVAIPLAFIYGLMYCYCAKEKTLVKI